MAEIERLIYDAHQANVTEVMFEGKTYNIGQWADTLGWHGRRAHELTSTDFINTYDQFSGNKTRYMGSEAQAFIDKYHAAKANGGMDDPVTDQVVTSLSNQILMVSGLYQDIGSPWDDFSDTATYGDTNDMTFESVDDYLITQSTHINAMGICHAGGSTDTGIKCQVIFGIANHMRASRQKAP